MVSRSLAAALPAAAALLLAVAGPARADVVTYNAPDGVQVGSGIEADASGRVWFTSGDLFSTAPRIGKLDVASAQAGTANGISLYSTPATSDSNYAILRDITLDPRDTGRIWWTRSDGSYGFGAVGSLAPNTANGMSSAKVNAGTGLIDMGNVAYDASVGKVWLTEKGATHNGSPQKYYGARVASTDGKGLGLNELPDLADQSGSGSISDARYDAEPTGIVPDGHGEAWFVESDPGLPGWRLAHTAGGHYTEYPLPGTGSSTGTGPNDTAVTPDGKVWFTNALTNAVTKFDPATQQFTSYSLRSFDSTFTYPNAITAAPDGSLWVAEKSTYSTGGVVKIVPSTTDATVTATVTKTSGFPLAISVAPTGDVWFTLTSPTTNTGLIGRITGGAGMTTAPGTDPTLPGTTTTPSAGGTPIVAAPTVMGSGSVGKAKTDGSNANVDQICVGPPSDVCSLVYIISAHEYVQGFPNTTHLGLLPRFAAKPKKSKKPKEPVVLGSATADLHGGETRTVAVPLGKKAAKALKKQKHFKATLTISQKQADGTLTQLSSKTVTFTYKKPKKGSKK